MYNILILIWICNGIKISRCIACVNMFIYKYEFMTEIWSSLAVSCKLWNPAKLFTSWFAPMAIDLLIRLMQGFRTRNMSHLSNFQISLSYFLFQNHSVWPFVSFCTSSMLDIKRLAVAEHSLHVGQLEYLFFCSAIPRLLGAVAMELIFYVRHEEDCCCVAQPPCLT